MAKMNRLSSLFVTIAILLGNTAMATLHISASLTETDVGLSESLDVNCTFTNDGASSVSAIVSLSLSHSGDSCQNFYELGIVNVFAPTKVTVFTTEGVTTAGVVSQVGESFLHMRCDYPGARESGVYKCSALGVDSVGHSVVITQTTEVSFTADELDCGDAVIDTLRSMKQQMAQLESYTQKLEQKLSALETQQQKSLEKMFELPPLNYDNRMYYVSKDGYFDVEVATSICNIYGADLVQIDSDLELAHLRVYLKTFISRPMYVVLVAGNDKREEGQWILPSNNNSIPYKDWYPNYPKKRTSHNCMVISPKFDHMWDEPCRMDPPTSMYRFMCEMTQS